MYDRQAMQLMAMVEAGIVKLGKAAGLEIVGAHKLEDSEAVLDAAETSAGFGKDVVFAQIDKTTPA